MGTKNNPGKFDCYDSAAPDEPMFILLGRDPCAGPVVRMWIQMRLDQGTISDAKADEAFARADAMEEWARAQGKDEALANAKGALRVVSPHAANGGGMNSRRR